MTWRATTESLIILLTVGATLYDVAARYFGGNDATISVVLADAAHRWPVVALAVGFLVGHIFFNVK